MKTTETQQIVKNYYGMNSTKLFGSIDFLQSSNYANGSDLEVIRSDNKIKLIRSDDPINSNDNDDDIRFNRFKVHQDYEQPILTNTLEYRIPNFNYKDAKDNTVQHIIYYFKDCYVEDGVSTKLEEYVKHDVIPQIGCDNAFRILNDLYLDYIWNSEVLILLLHTISHFDYDSIKPNGQMMAISALSHDNLEVKDYGIKAFENWNQKKSIKMLQRLETSSEFINEYIKDVVAGLERFGE